MSITNGSAVLASDCNALITAQLALMQADAAQLPLGHAWNFFFHGLVASTGADASKAVVVVPFDCSVECLAVEAADFTAASTVTVDVAGDGALGNFPITLTAAAVGSGRTQCARVLFDGTAGPVGSIYMAANQAFRSLKKGSTLTITCSTTSVATASALHVALVLRSRFGRQG